MQIDWLIEAPRPDAATGEPCVFQLNDDVRFEVTDFGALDVKRVRGRTRTNPIDVHVSDDGYAASRVNLVVPVHTPMSVRVPGINGSRHSCGDTHFWHLPEERWADYHVAAGTPINSVGVTVSLEFLAEAAREQRVPDSFEALLSKGYSPPFFISRNTGPALQQAATQILNHPYQGALARLYTQGKAMEIAALALAALHEPEPTRCRSLSEWERRRIRDARERLVQNLRSPPSIRELAQAVGLPATRLQLGFREEYGAPVFRWLQNYRLDAARELLEKEVLSIKEIAFRLGYVHVTNFTNAFRRRFGCPPGAVRHRKR